MKAVRIALALALLCLCSPAADIAPVVSWSVETNALQPSQRGRKDLEIVRGETAVLECQLLSGGAAINLAEATSVLFRYTPANPATNATHLVITGSVHSAAAGKVRVRWTPAAAPAADRLQYEIAVGSPTATVSRAWGLLRLLPGVGDDSTAGGVERSTIDWSTVDSQNEGDAPWPIYLEDLLDTETDGASVGDGLVYDGTNWVASAGSGDMSRLVYDTDEDGKVDVAEAVEGVDFGSFATTGHVAAAVAAVHPALTLKPGSIGALAGQELEISPAMVGDALAGLTIRPITVRAPNGEATIIESPPGEVIQLIPDDDSGEGSVNVNGAMSITGNVAANGFTGDGSGLAGVVPGNGTVTAAKTTITEAPNGSKFLRDDWSWQLPPSPVWAVEWGPGEIVGPFYDGTNDAAGWSRKAEVNGTYPTGIAGMGMSSTLTTLQDVTIYVHRHTPKAATALDTSAAFEITFWTTTASAADQKFDLVISGSNRSGGSQTTVYTKTGIVGGAGVVTTLVIPVGAVSYYETSAGTVTNQAESLSSSTLYRMYTFKIVTYSKSSNRVNFVGGVVNGR